MSDVTRILSQIEMGNQRAAEELLPLVYDELRKLAATRLAQEKPGQTLQATALVHEAYLRLMGGQGSGVRDQESEKWNSRGHFFGAAAEAMRRILVDEARRKGRQKRGGTRRRLDLESAELMLAVSPDDLIDLDDALSRLTLENKQGAEIAKLRLFAGMSVEQAAQSLDTSRSIAFDHWAYARAWLTCELADRPASA